MEIKEQFVEFDKFCPKCKHYKKLESEEPCWECLNEPYNLYTNRPVKFEEEEK